MSSVTFKFNFYSQRTRKIRIKLFDISGISKDAYMM